MMWQYIKGYLRYKTITSQNVSSEGHVKNLFYFIEKLSFVLKIFKFFIFKYPMIYQMCDVMISIST